MSQPNILLLFTDQQRFDTIAALGNNLIRTPVMDRLVREGTAFTHCYTPSPVCVAARCSLVTGLPPHQTGCTANQAMPQDIPSFMEKLGEAGYQTHGVGKMHFTPDSQRLWGFETRDISEELNSTHDDFTEFLNENGYGHVLEPLGIRSEYYYIPQPSQLPARLHNTTWVADRSCDFLKRRDRKRPFFLWSSFIKPHPPFETPTPWEKLYRCAQMPPPFRPEGFEDLLTYWNHYQNRYKYRDHGYDELLVRTMRAAYYSCISFVDYNIGRILAALGEDVDDTLILLSADHGELLGDYGSFGKRSMLDPAVRVPLVVRWPKKVPAGVRCDVPTTLLDVYPTFLSAAGLPDTRACDEGEDLITLADLPPRDRVVYSQFSEREQGLYMAASRRGKYIYSAADQREWFFDREPDVPETRDASQTHPSGKGIDPLRSDLLRRLAQGPHAEKILENGTWRKCPKTTIPDDPDAALLIQDPARVKPELDQLKDYTGPASHPATSYLPQ